MASSSRRARQRDRPSTALSMLGNVLLLLATVAVTGMVIYLVLNPPGVLEPASQQSIPTAPVVSTTPSPAPVATAPAPPPATTVDPGTQLTLESACGAVNPLLGRADDISTAAQENPDTLNSTTISDLTRELQALSDVSPPELKALIDPLNALLVGLNNALLAGEERPQLDIELAHTSSEDIRTLCGL